MLLTSVGRDGLSSGYGLVQLKTVSDVARVPVIASGGGGALNRLVFGS